MRRFAFLIPLLLIVVVAPPAARAGHATPNLDGIAEAIDSRLQNPHDPGQTKDEQKCEKAFLRARDILAQDSLTEAADLKLLKKVEKLLRRWFHVELDVEEAIDLSTNEFSHLVTRLGVEVQLGLAGLEREKDVRKLEKLMARLEKRLMKVADAATTKKRIKHLGPAIRLAVKAVAIAEAAPKKPASTGSGGAIVTLAPDGGDIPALFRFDLPAVAGTAALKRQISTGNGPVRQLEILREGGGLSALYRQDTDLFLADVKAASAEPRNLTANLDPLDGGDCALSPDRESVVVWTASGPRFLIRFVDDEVYPLGSGSAIPRNAVWCGDGNHIALTSGGNLDVATFNGTGYDLTTVAGPGVDGQSAGDVVASPRDILFAWTGIPTQAAGTRLNVMDPVTGKRVQVHDSVIAMNSDQDVFRSDRVAGAWTAPRELAFATPGGLARAAFDTNLDFATPDIVDAGSREFTVHANTDAVTALHAGVPGVMVLRYDKPSVGPVFERVGDTGNGEQTSALLGDRHFAYSNRETDDAPRVRIRDLTNGNDVAVSTPEPDTTKAAGAYVRGVKIWHAPNALDVFFAFNFVTNDDAKGGIWVGLTGGGDELGNILFPGAVVVPREEETTFNTYGVELLDEGESTRVGMGLVAFDFQAGISILLTAEGIADSDGIDIGIVIPISETFGNAGFTFWFK